MPLRVLRSIAVAALLASVLCAPAAARRHNPNATALRPVFLTKPPPDFSYTVGTATHRLRDLVGRPVVLNFWASFCEPCIGELDAFEKISQTYGDKVDVLTIDSEDPWKAQPYLATHGYDLPLVEDTDHTIRDLYGVEPIPATIFIDAAGVVRKVVIGELSWPELQSTLDAELAVPPTPAPAGSSAPVAAAPPTALPEG